MKCKVIPLDIEDIVDYNKGVRKSINKGTHI